MREPKVQIIHKMWAPKRGATTNVGGVHKKNNAFEGPRPKMIEIGKPKITFN
ncbi:MAG: hypothetical protein BJ554DRAFT_4514 [Olpidium bornovanus]|uniref:Uncharacterized protein n=1 Tax=Olpidium bornovanus TaxID=278681 RepID=A0A8H8DEM4_9FUNG|nr:MAG: hypothetical protein BJ554DRAFT_4514 [Olpidium bornovanus]